MKMLFSKPDHLTQYLISIPPPQSRSWGFALETSWLREFQKKGQGENEGARADRKLSNVSSSTETSQPSQEGSECRITRLESLF